MWKPVIRLILATDVAKRFTILEEARQLKRDWTKSEKGRCSMMGLVIKAADVWRVARLFDHADRLTPYLCEGFFRYGEL
jgi:hypothetical protein